MLTLAARRHRVRTAALLVELGLFPGQDLVLQSLGKQDGMTMGEIADQLSIRPPTASKMIARMTAQGLLERRGKEDDARLVAVFITDAGKALIEKLGKIAKKIEKDALVGFDDKDIRRLRRNLKRVAKNLGGQLRETDESDEETEV
ncbi:MAG: MarR family winged helix-turn-helix transcriptional regulator [Beijerinckiaceae bacterium]